VPVPAEYGTDGGVGGGVHTWTRGRRLIFFTQLAVAQLPRDKAYSALPAAGSPTSVRPPPSLPAARTTRSRTRRRKRRRGTGAHVQGTRQDSPFFSSGLQRSSR
jgi:hypothetical protein